MATELFCGVDIGASATKLVLLAEGSEAVAQVVSPSGVDYTETARAALAKALEAVPDGKVVRAISTGYGRANVPFVDASMTEIHCHGVGCFHHVPEAITIVDIGGQDNKVIHLDAEGHRIDFRMNRKCAAGTGSFVEEIALRLAVPIEHMDPLARTTDRAVRMSSFCTVFAKTEVLAHLRKGVPVAEIVRGTFLSVVQRVLEMDPLDGKVVMTGGVVAHNPSVVEILSEKLGRPVTVPPQAQLTGALGAALVARQQHLAAFRQEG